MIGKTNGGSGGTGATLTVTAPAGCTVTISKDGKTKTKTAGTDGVAVFKGLATGTWTVTITNGSQQATKTVTVTADYSTSIMFFAATINVTYPAGSTCTATDGVTTLTAPDTSGTWACVVPNAGTWVAKTETDKGTFESDPVAITQNGQFESVTVEAKLYIYKGSTGKFIGEMHVELGDASANITVNSGTLTESDGYFEFRVGYAAVYVKDKIDISKFSTICFDYKDDSTATHQTAILGYAGRYAIHRTDFIGKYTISSANNGIRKTVTCNMSDSGSYYVGFAKYNGYENSDPNVHTLICYNWWLE